MSADPADIPFWRAMPPGSHYCHLYHGEPAFLDSLGAYIGSALWSDGAAIVVATPNHLARIETRLRLGGLDLAHMRSTDRLVTLAAEFTLAQFMVDGMPDAARFEATLMPVIDRARRGGRELRAFGEMVMLLWGRGEYAATVRLEELWTALVEREGLRLLCAYPRDLFDAGNEEHCRAVANAHHEMLAA